MAQTITCATIGIFARCIASKLRCNSYTSGSIQRKYCTKVEKKSTDEHKDLPKAPKRPLTAYIEFYVSHLDEIRQNNKDVKEMSELSKIGGRMWNELDANTKQEYVTKYKMRLDAYHEEVNNFNDSLTEEQKVEIKEEKAHKKEEKKAKRERKDKIRKMREFHMPKRPCYPFSCYVRHESSGRPEGVRIQDYMKTVAEQWRNLTEKEKKVFYDESSREHELYEEKITDWVEQMVEEGNGKEVDRNLLKRELAKLGLPMSPRSSYGCYLSSNHVGIRFGNKNHWRDLSKEEREPYEIQAAEDKVRYRKELAEWNENMDVLGKEDFVLEAQLLLRQRDNKTNKNPKDDHEISSSESDSD